MPIQATTYNSLVADIKAYTSRGQDTDTSFVNQIPRIINKCEFQLARECKTLITQPPITGVLEPGNPTVEKPSRWRNTLYFNITVATDPSTPNTYDTRRTLFMRPYETIVQYWPNRSLTGIPKFYGDYDINHWYIGPTPAYEHPFEFVMDERIEPLTVENQTNYLTQFLPDLLLNACLLESDIFLQRWERVEDRKAAYMESLQSATAEEKDRMSDKTQNVGNG